LTRLSNSLVPGSALLLALGCGQVIGLSEYEIDESLDAESADGSGGTSGGDGDVTGGGGIDGEGGADSGGTGGTDPDGSGGGAPIGCEDDCDDDNECTVDACVGNKCTHIALGQAEPCAGGVCNGSSIAPACVRCADTQGGTDTDAGCTEEAPTCNENGDAPICTGCEQDSDCSDTNECTSDTCNAAGECVIGTAPAGTACNGGVCNGAVNSESCEVCVDDGSANTRDTGCGPAAPICDASGTPSCNTCVDDSDVMGIDSGCSAGAPLCINDSCSTCINDASGLETDTGCNAGAPLCVNDRCQQCVVPADCADDGHACSVETCNSGVCETAYNHTACAENSDVCKKNVQCTSSGCTSEDDSALIDLLEGDGDFESNASWVGDTQYIRTPLSGAAHGGSQVAQMTTGSNQDNNLYQVLDLPAGTQSLTTRGYYKSYGTGTDHADDFVLVGYWNNSFIVDAALSTGILVGDDDPLVSDWTLFESTIQYADLDQFPSAGQVEFDLVGATDGNGSIRYYAVDDVVVEALVCPAP